MGWLPMIRVAGEYGGNYVPLSLALVLAGSLLQALIIGRLLSTNLYTPLEAHLSKFIRSRTFLILAIITWTIVLFAVYPIADSRGSSAG